MSTINLPSLPKSYKEACYWPPLPKGADALAIYQAALQHDSTTLVITADTDSARRIESELNFYIAENDQLEVLHLPDWETLPYEAMSPHQDITSERISTLYRLTATSKGVLVIPFTTLMHRLAPREYLAGNSLILKVGEQFLIEQTRLRLEANGYNCVDSVYEHGEFAIRGSLIDIFPMGSNLPCRIDLFDDEIETLRLFDPETQRSQEKIPSIELLPAHEFPLDKKGISRFRDQWHQTFDVDHKQCPIYQDVSSGLSPSGIEYYLPLFFEQTNTIFDYLPESTLTIQAGELENAGNQFWSESFTRYESRSGDRLRPILPPHSIFVPIEEIFHRIKQMLRIDIRTRREDVSANQTGEISETTTLSDIDVDHRLKEPYQRLQNWLSSDPSQRILFCAESAGRKEALAEILKQQNIDFAEAESWSQFITDDYPVALCIAPLESGYLIADQLALVTESELFGTRIRQRRRSQQKDNNSEYTIKSLTELRIGAAVVHLDHGVGRYLGLESITVDGETNEFLTLEYAGGAKLYVPVSNLEMISRYSGGEDSAAPLHRLGTDQWQKAKKKAIEQIKDTAAELLDIYARRAAKKGYAFDNPADSYQTFAADFPFEETPDQYDAINAVKNDMCSPRPMDRLVCGDVGFGKTEVAMRAAFIAASNSKQVAMLVPTTLLAQQHFENFRDRFADWPIKVGVISRFKSSKDTNQLQQDVEDGKVDIIIGTHKLLQSDMKFKNLGLLIIDEEHRFGVQQKERLKSLRSEVDILTLTATPIPRTLNLAVSGIRDLSIISTPPAKRLSVKTLVSVSDDAMIKEAILRELLRGGQVYFLHNEVKSIERIADELTKLVPEARVGVAHGQMRERQLESVMSDFYHKRFNVLVCTTIIETGIDVPNANTIIIERADKFGLAQLHQLRGRVGRSHHQAYAYLLTPPTKSLSGDAQKRLDAIAQTTDLGAGFMLATHDLEIRGAGELLGEEQSGQIQTIGFTLYTEMLDRAVKAIQSGKAPEDILATNIGPDVNLRLPALIPDDYLPDVNSRLELYKRISAAADKDALKDLQVEMIDRFGLLPEPVKLLFEISELKLRAKAMGISKVEAGISKGRIEFLTETKVEPLTLIKLVQTQPQKFGIKDGTALTFEIPMEEHRERVDRVNDLLDQLTA